MTNNYAITNQTEGYTLDPSAGPVQGMTINATTVPYDIAFTVTIPISEYTPANVNAYLTMRAAAIIQVHDGES